MGSMTATTHAEYSRSFSSSSSVISVKATTMSSGPSSPVTAATGSTLTTLRSLYSRAARAFLHRDVALTYTLMASARHLLAPPDGTESDWLDSQRRKWDILRITLDTTVFVSPSSPPHSAHLPSQTKEMLTMTPQAMLNSSYGDSVKLFTPKKHKPSSAWLPSQVLAALVLSSIKLGAPDVGRFMIEDWLGHRTVGTDTEGYEKALDLYCLQVLPRLEEWSYAQEFLEYESELSVENRKRIQGSLEILHTQRIASSLKQTVSEQPSLVPHSQYSPRSISPSPSTSSSSTSLSTTSTHTAVPPTPRGPLSNGLSALTSVRSRTPMAQSVSSQSSDQTIRRVDKGKDKAADKQIPLSTYSHARDHTDPACVSSRDPSTSSPARSLERRRTGTPQLHISATSVSTPPSFFSLVRASLAPHLTRPKVTTFILLFIIFPLLSVLFRIRRRRRHLSSVPSLSNGQPGSLAGAHGVSAAETARRRLAASSRAKSLSGLDVAKLWTGVMRTIVDTVKMGGRGLV